MKKLPYQEVAHALSSSVAPIVTDYDLAALLCRVAVSAGIEIDRHRYHYACRRFSETGLLSPHPDFPSGRAYALFGKKDAAPEAIACAADPFAYLSHLSAMEHHGLTDRFAKAIYLCTPPPAEWKSYAAARMDHDLGQHFDAYLAAGLPRLRPIRLDKIKGHVVHTMQRSHRGAFKHVQGTPLRVATLGRTFLDMLREPGFCGGLQHVIDIYRDYAQRYLSLIVDEVERHGNAIDKVRAGYVLEEVCHLEHPTIAGWRQYAQRGGSRKLDATAAYAETYSENWQLSINVPFLAEGDNDEP